MALWPSGLGTGLQNLVRGFDSRRRLFFWTLLISELGPATLVLSFQCLLAYAILDPWRCP